MLREVTTQLTQNKWIIIILLRKETKNQLLNMVMLWARNPMGGSGSLAVRRLCSSPLHRNPRDQCLSPFYKWQKLTEVPDTTPSSRAASLPAHSHPNQQGKRCEAPAPRTEVLQRHGSEALEEHTWLSGDSGRNNYNIAALQTFWQLLRSQEAWNGKHSDVMVLSVSTWQLEVQNYT